MGDTAGAFTNVSVLKSWLSGMGVGAAKNDVGILYCCAPPNIHMNGVTVPAAYAVRASPDYVWGARGHAIKLPTVQWAIGPDNAFHWSGLGLLPYKDTFISNSSSTQQSGEWSTDENMWPSFKGYHERNAGTHALMSLLSMASVTFGDAVGESNKTLLMRLCRSDGVLLKADRPATAMDAQFQAMMFGAWPGQAVPPPSPPTGPRPSVTLAKCVAGDPMQSFTSSSGGALRLAGKNSQEGCIDVGGCKTTAGAAVHLYNNTLGPCGSISICHGKNEQWQISGGVIKSVLAPTLCLKVATASGEATLAKCDPKDKGQAFVTNAAVAAAGGSSFAIVSQGDPSSCLTGFTPPAAVSVVGEAVIATPLRGAFSWDSEEQETEVTDALFPVDGGQLSEGYRHAYATSAVLMEKLEAARRSAERKQQAAAQAGETCAAGYGAPQGPLGEVYSTHVTISGMTWRYVVGVQLSADFNISASDMAIRPAGVTDDAGEFDDADVAVAAVAHVSYKFDDATTFKPMTSADLAPFGGASDAKLTLRRSDGELCETAPRFKITTKCFPFQWHAIAPVAASNGWALTGEVGKFMPVSSQRIASVAAVAGGGFSVELKGAVGEVVEMGAADVNGGKAPVYARATIGSAGTATLKIGT